MNHILTFVRLALNQASEKNKCAILRGQLGKLREGFSLRTLEPCEFDKSPPSSNRQESLTICHLLPSSRPRDRADGEGASG